MTNLQGKNDLKGLFYVFIASILSLVSELAMSGGNRVLTTICEILAFVALVLILIGLSKVKDVSPHFKTARTMYILQIVMLVVVAIAAVVAVVSAGAGQGVGVIVLMIALILLAVFDLLATINLLRGCANVAMDNNEKGFARKCHRVWKLYVIAIIVMIVGVLIIGIIAVNNVGLIQNMSDGQLSNFVAKLGAGVIVVIIAAILLLIAEILKIVRVYQTYKKFGAGSAPTAIQ